MQTREKSDRLTGLWLRRRQIVHALQIIALTGATLVSQVCATAEDVLASAESNIVAPSETRALRELKTHLRGTNTDLALMNWLVAADIPEFGNMAREDYFKQLDALTEQVRHEMLRMQKVAVQRGESLDAPRTRCAIFCNAMIKLGFAYAEEFRQENVTPALLKSLYANPDHICLAGLLRTRRGSCVSMPLIYLVIGQRLDTPVHLVCVGKHYFVRWEEPGYHMNIEATIVDRVAVSPDDSVYLEVEGLKPGELRGSDLRNLTAREVVGHLLFARSGYWGAKGADFSRQQRDDLSLARELAPDDYAIKMSHEAALRHAGSQVDSTTPASNPASKGKSL